MSEKKKKSLFDKAIDALTARDEKEAAAVKAAEENAAAEKAAAMKAAAEKAADERSAAMRAASKRAAAERVAAAKAAADERIAAEKTAAPKKGIVTVRSLRIRADHNTASEVVGGLVDGNEVTIHSTWSDGKDTWARLDKGWAAMVYDGETYIKLV
ncbi:MAG TPA: SH3 domain-containing protein [Anaerolineales bacterium]|nr:SH3 domain-containing protein [Anaerolineales bacterium]